MNVNFLKRFGPLFMKNFFGLALELKTKAGGVARSVVFNFLLTSL